MAGRDMGNVVRLNQRPTAYSATGDFSGNGSSSGFDKGSDIAPANRQTANEPNWWEILTKGVGAGIDAASRTNPLIGLMTGGFFSKQEPTGNQGIPIRDSGETDLGRDFGEYDSGNSGGVQSDLMQQLINSLKTPYNGEGIDGRYIDEALAARLGATERARGLAQNNFNTFDTNVRDMYAANRTDQLNQSAGIKAQNQDYQNQLKGIFQNTIDDNQGRQGDYNAQRTEMLQRLGIQAAANQPDLVGKSISDDTSAAQSSRDARLAEAVTNGQTSLTRNTLAANALNNDAASRRSELNQALQGIFGNLDNQDAGYRADAANAKQQLQTQNEQRNYARWLQGQQLNNDTLNTMRQSQNDQANQALKLAQAQYTAQAKAGNTNTANSLIGNSNPAVVQAFQTAMNDGGNPADLRDMFVRIGKANPQLDPDEVMSFITSYSKVKG